MPWNRRGDDDVEKKKKQVFNGNGETVDPGAYLEGMLGDVAPGNARQTFDR